jgi:hypothetical protein
MTACRDATTAACQAAAPIMSTRGAGQTAGSRDDHAMRLVAPLHRSNVDVIQRGHCCQQCRPRRLIHADGLTDRCRHHEVD